MSLREGGMQFLSFPFDWTGGPTVCQKIDLLCRDFEGWMRRENFVKKLENRFDHSVYWKDEVLGYYFVHEFNDKSTLDDQLPAVRARLMARGKRLIDLIGRAKRVLVVFVETPEFGRESVANMAQARQLLMRRWPNVSFDMLLFQNENDRRRHAALDSEADGVRHVVFDYRDRRESLVRWMADQFEIGKWLRRNYRVTDYRTDEERRQWAVHKRQKELARFAASGWVDYFITKCRYKLYVHLRKRLARKGLV